MGQAVHGRTGRKTFPPEPRQGLAPGTGHLRREPGPWQIPDIAQPVHRRRPDRAAGVERQGADVGIGNLCPGTARTGLRHERPALRRGAAPRQQIFHQQPPERPGTADGLRLHGLQGYRGIQHLPPPLRILLCQRKQAGGDGQLEDAPETSDR